MSIISQINAKNADMVNRMKNKFIIQYSKQFVSDPINLASVQSALELRDNLCSQYFEEGTKLPKLKLCRL